MGMFDEITGFSAPCVNCGIKLDNWQSKDGPCVLAVLDYKEVDNFYTICPNCKHWNEYARELIKPTGPEEYKFIGEAVK